MDDARQNCLLQAGSLQGRSLQVRSFSLADRIAMRAIYRRCCGDLGLADGSSRLHQALARTILERYAAGATDPDRLAVLALARVRRMAVRPRSLWASLATMLWRHEPVRQA